MNGHCWGPPLLTWVNFELKGFSPQKLIQISSSLLLDTEEAILNQVVPLHQLCFVFWGFFLLFFSAHNQICWLLQKHKDKSDFLKAAASPTQTHQIRNCSYFRQNPSSISTNSDRLLWLTPINIVIQTQWNWFTFRCDGGQNFLSYLFIHSCNPIVYFSFKFKFKWFYWPLELFFFFLSLLLIATRHL